MCLVFVCRFNIGSKFSFALSVKKTFKQQACFLQWDIIRHKCSDDAMLKRITKKNVKSNI